MFGVILPSSFFAADQTSSRIIFGFSVPSIFDSIIKESNKVRSSDSIFCPKRSKVSPPARSENFSKSVALTAMTPSTDPNPAASKSRSAAAAEVGKSG